MFTERRGLRSLRTSPKQLDKLEFNSAFAIYTVHAYEFPRSWVYGGSNVTEQIREVTNR